MVDYHGKISLFILFVTRTSRPRQVSLFMHHIIIITINKPCRITSAISHTHTPHFNTEIYQDNCRANDEDGQTISRLTGTISLDYEFSWYLILAYENNIHHSTTYFVLEITWQLRISDPEKSSNFQHKVHCRLATMGTPSKHLQPQENSSVGKHPLTVSISITLAKVDLATTELCCATFITTSVAPARGVAIPFQATAAMRAVLLWTVVVISAAGKTRTLSSIFSFVNRDKYFFFYKITKIILNIFSLVSSRLHSRVVL